MKVKGPGGPRLPAQGQRVDKAGSKPAAAPRGESFADKVSAQAPEKSRTAPAAPEQSDAIRQVTTRLASGEITRQQAVSELVDAVIAQGPGRVLGPKQRAALRAHLEETLDSDPVLAEQVRALGGDDAD